MAVWVWCELVCRGCAQTGPGQQVLSASIPRGRLVSEAKDRGWKQKGNEMYCPDCKPPQDGEADA